MSEHASFRARSLNRRQFIYRSTLASAATLAAWATASPRRLGAADKLRIACVGVGGKGRSDVEYCAGEEVVALCDVDLHSAADARRAFPKAKFYVDWREMLDKAAKNIDAVTVSTPDHLHGLIASAAIKLGKHVYCQKPLTQTVYEARYLRTLVREYGVVTQMGNQGSAEDGMRRAVEVVQSGVIGPVRQIHVWTDRPLWGQGLVRPAAPDPVPSELRWDLWLGPSAPRPFNRAWSKDRIPWVKPGREGVYHTFGWRGWYEFGCGSLGDMACHTSNLPFRGAKLGYPTLIEVLDHSELNADTYPKTSKIRFVFPPREGLPETEFFWYDGNPDDKSCAPFRPRDDITHGLKELVDEVPRSGCLLIGEKGQIFSPDDYNTRFFLRLNDEKEFVSGSAHEAVKSIPVSLPRNLHKGDSDLRQHLEWIAACKGGPTPYSNFDVAAYLTEIILLGCVALRVGKRLEWDGPKMRATNAPEAARFVKRDYREGWRLA